MAKVETDTCPHWAQDDRRCLLSCSGLYIPVQEHIDIYCRGGNYACCSQFINCLAVDNKNTADQGLNLRRFSRIPARFSFRLAASEEEDVNRIIDDAATTVDFSPGGIRFESYRSLKKGARVTFSLNGDFAEPPLHGIGQVKWCYSLENSPIYHAGIAFADPDVAGAIRRRLGLAKD